MKIFVGPKVNVFFLENIFSSLPGGVAHSLKGTKESRVISIFLEIYKF